MKNVSWKCVRWKSVSAHIEAFFTLQCTTEGKWPGQYSLSKIYKFAQYIHIDAYFTLEGKKKGKIYFLSIHIHNAYVVYMYAYFTLL